MISLQPKSIQITPPKNITLDHLDDRHPISDDPISKILTVNVNCPPPQALVPSRPQVVVTFSGSAYDAFYASYGDGYTDADINSAIMERLGLVVPS